MSELSGGGPFEPRDVAALRALTGQGHQPKYLFFWGHSAHPSGRIGRSCLSQWWPSPFTVDGVTYRTAEHWMMAQKARLFGDENAFERIVAAGHPKQAKDLGRQVHGFDDAVWAAHRFQIVTDGGVAKFGQNPELKAYLIGTGRRVLVEASPVDPIWGIGLAADDDRAEIPERWPGLNLLGFALMEARAVLTTG